MKQLMAGAEAQTTLQKPKREFEAEYSNPDTAESNIPAAARNRRGSIGFY
jgi:hypothetical protein